MPSHLTNWFRLVLEASWQSSLIILLILMVRPLMGIAIPARWRSWLWALVLVRLLVPITVFPPNPVSMQNLAMVNRPFQQDGLVPAPTPETSSPATLFPQGWNAPAPISSPDKPPGSGRGFRVSWWSVAAATWLAGMLVSLGIMVRAQSMFWRRLGRNRQPVDSGVLAIWEECCQRLRIARRPALCASRDITLPALVGLTRPILLLPEGKLAALSPDDWENIFVHELAHYRRADHWTHAVQLVAQAVHWFNPMVWLGFRQLRADRELAADEWALQHLDPERSVGYGETLLKVLAQSSGHHLSIATVGILEDRVQLKQRLRRIMGFAPRQLIGSVLGLGIVFAVAVLVLGRPMEKVDLSQYRNLKPDEILVTAAQRGDIPVIRKMLRDGVNIEAAPAMYGGRTALFTAVASNQMPATRFLVSEGADINRTSNGRPTAVRAALDNGKSEFVAYLLDHGAVCDPALIAAYKGDRPALQSILAQKPANLDELELICRIASVNGQADVLRFVVGKIKALPGQSLWEVDYSTTLAAISHGHREVVQAILDESPYSQRLNQGGVMRIGAAAAQSPGMRDWLISKGFSVPEYTDGERLIDAAEDQNLPEMERLLKSGVDVNYRGESSWTPITKAAAWNLVSSMKFLLAHGADPNSVHLPGWDYTPICLTAKPEIADMVFAAGGKVNATLYKRGVHIMDYSVTFGQTDMVKWYIAHGVDPTKVQADGPDKTFLFDAGNPEIAAILIQHGVNVKARDKNGDTALHQICMFGKNPAEIARVLLKNGADPNARDNDGITPLMRAKDGATVDVLVEYGADVHAKTKDGQSLLSEGGSYADPTWMQALIRHGAAFDLKTDGPTKLMKAAWMGQLDVMSSLLSEGVDPNLKGTWNKAANAYMTPLTAAVVFGHYDAARLLVEHGAKIDQQLMSDALANRRVSIVKLFWEHGAHFLSPLTYAVTQGASVQEVKKMVDQGTPIDPPSGEISAMAEAALLGNLPVVEFLAEKEAGSRKAGTPAPNPSLAGPLLKAASEGQDEIVAYLLQHGGKAEYGDVMEAANNSTPYFDQRSKEHFEKTVEILIEAGALKEISAQNFCVRSSICHLHPSGAWKPERGQNAHRRRTQRQRSGQRWQERAADGPGQFASKQWGISFQGVDGSARTSRQKVNFLRPRTSWASFGPLGRLFFEGRSSVPPTWPRAGSTAA